MFVALLVITSSFVISLAGGFAVHRMLARYGIVDVPNTRSSHKCPTVRGGGIGIVVVILMIGFMLFYHRSSMQGAIILCCVSFLAGVSFWDDLNHLHPAIRISCHSLAAVVVLACLFLHHPLSVALFIPDYTFTSFVIFLGAFLLLTGYTNAFNFMDGINGIAAFQAAITGTGSALIIGINYDDWTSFPVLLNFLTAGCALGFLPQNFPTARMFMGDVGSTTLGYFLAILVCWAAIIYGSTVLVPLLLVHTNFILDTGITLVRRISSGEKWYEAHQEHFYQRLVRSGKSHTQVTLSEAALQIVAISLLLRYPSYTSEVRVFVGITVIGIWIAFFCYAENMFRRADAANTAANVTGLGSVKRR